MKLKCSLCGKPYEFDYQPGGSLGTFPFCSERCKLIDLGKWLDEEYRLSTPVPELDGLEPEERRRIVQFLLDSGLIDEVIEDEADPEADGRDRR